MNQLFGLQHRSITEPMIGFNRKRYYEYHSGYRPVPPDHEQYIRQAILRYGWTEPVEFNAYVEDYLW